MSNSHIRGSDIELAITKPLHSVSHALFLDRPRRWLEDRAGNGEKPVASVLLPTATTKPNATTATTGASAASTTPSTLPPVPPIR